MTPKITVTNHKMTSAMSKRWCFTVNNYVQCDIDQFHEEIEADYCITGKEVGASGTPHLQGYIVFSTNKRLAAVKKLHATAHWEIARGSTEQNITYCSKEGDVMESGERPMSKKEKGEGEKRRWAEAFEACKKGDFDAVPADIRFRYYRTTKEIAKDHMKKVVDADDVTGVWIYGAPGIGKSRKAREDYPGAYFKNQNKWWDGYQGEDYVIIDDFDSKELSHLLKIWADRYSFIAENKGGAMHIRPKKIVITSNFSIDEVFRDSPADTVLALKRRFKVIHMLERFGPQKFM